MLTFLLLPLALGTDLEECKGVMIPQESPCYLLLKNTTGFNCENINVSVYNNVSTLLYTQAMSKFNPIFCNATFNQSDLGTYTFEYKSSVFVDSGSIIIQGSELKMISIMLGLIAVALFFWSLAFFNNSLAFKVFGYGNVLIQVFNIVFLLYANELGQDLSLTLKVNMIVTIIGVMALVLITIFFITIRLFMPTESMPEETDLLKWAGNDLKWQGKN